MLFFANFVSIFADFRTSWIWLFGNLSLFSFLFLFSFSFSFFFRTFAADLWKKNSFFHVQAFLGKPISRADYVSSVFREKGMLFSLSWDVRCWLVFSVLLLSLMLRQRVSALLRNLPRTQLFVRPKPWMMSLSLGRGRRLPRVRRQRLSLSLRAMIFIVRQWQPLTTHWKWPQAWMSVSVVALEYRRISPSVEVLSTRLPFCLMVSTSAIHKQDTSLPTSPFLLRILSASRLSKGLRRVSLALRPLMGQWILWLKEVKEN